MTVASTLAPSQHPVAEGAGIVRPARRPPGWQAPGPRPAGDGGDPALLPGPGEDLCHLAGDFRIFQRLGGHRWSLDDLVTAGTAIEFGCATPGAPPASFLDLGCGIGSILMLLAWRLEGSIGTGIEIQPASVALARRSLRWNGLETRVGVVAGDLCGVSELVAGRRFELVTGSPPYFPEGRALASPDEQRHRCRIETRGGIESYCVAAATVLAERGRFVVCLPGGPDGRIESAAEAAGLMRLVTRPVVPRAGKAPLFWVHVLVWPAEAAGAVVGDGPAGGPELPPFVVRDRAGHWTDEFRALRTSMGMPV